MRGGLITTDLAGVILLLNRTGEEILGHRFADVRGKKLQELNQDFWLPGQYPNVEKLSLRKEIHFRTPQGEVRYLGISVSPMRLGSEERSGYVFNFQDLTDLRRLEQEVATKERMAALGRLSAAIAHEIRQPLTAMAGAVFFFQAEDGIRDVAVTGVQTCALPISTAAHAPARSGAIEPIGRSPALPARAVAQAHPLPGKR